MAIDRRQFLNAALALTASGISETGLSAPGEAQRLRYVSSARTRSGQMIIEFDQFGRAGFSVALDWRGHGIAFSQSRRELAVFCRRPGTESLILSVQNSAARTISTPYGHHFCGHGFYSANGRLLYATENDHERQRGLLGIFDADDNYRRAGEIDTRGIGPHEAILMRNARIAVVANGGIETHPDFPRRKLNLGSIESSLVYLDISTGELVDKAPVPSELGQSSLRHITEAADEEIWFGNQYYGPKTDAVKLIGSHRIGEQPRFLEAPGRSYASLRQYVGSVESNVDGTAIAVTSPRGNRLMVWDSLSRTLLHDHDIEDVCGVAAAGSGFVASSGKGDVFRNGTWLAHHIDTAWDNHILALSPSTA